jgi:hypothetical protein
VLDSGAEYFGEAMPYASGCLPSSHYSVRRSAMEALRKLQEQPEAEMELDIPIEEAEQVGNS